MKNRVLRTVPWFVLGWFGIVLLSELVVSGTGLDLGAFATRQLERGLRGGSFVWVALMVVGEQLHQYVDGRYRSRQPKPDGYEVLEWGGGGGQEELMKKVWNTVGLSLLAVLAAAAVVEFVDGWHLNALVLTIYGYLAQKFGLSLVLLPDRAVSRRDAVVVVVFVVSAGTITLMEELVQLL